MISPKIIMSPIDFSRHSNDALETAVQLAGFYRSELLLVHVVPAIPKLPSPITIFHEHEYEEELFKDASNCLEEVRRKVSEGGLSAKAVVGRANEVAMELLRIAEHNQVGLIVISTHGMTGWHEFAFGSVTEKVVRHAECPVLVLRANVAPE